MIVTEEMIEIGARAMRELDRSHAPGQWLEWERAKPEHRQRYLERSRAALTAALAASKEGCIAAIVKNDEADCSELIIRDGPHFTGTEARVYPVYDMATRECIGFRWYGDLPQERQDG